MVPGLGGYFEIIKFKILELMTLSMRAGSQEVSNKHCIGLQAVQWTWKNVQSDNLHASLYKTDRNWVNVLTGLINYSRSTTTDAVP
jgi:hypothetical protein